MVRRQKTIKEMKTQLMDCSAWDKTRKIPKGKQRILHYYANDQLYKDMRDLAQILIQMEIEEPGTGIKRNNPSAMGKFCVEAAVRGLKKAFAKMESETESDANA
jgi:hypothetical protein